METLLLGTRNFCYLVIDTTGVHFITYLISSWSSKTPSSVPIVTLHPSKGFARVSVMTAQREGHFCPCPSWLSCASLNNGGYSSCSQKLL